MTKPVYIRSVVALSDDEGDYRRWLKPIEARRMSRLLRRALDASLTALDRAGVLIPDGIITATQWGCWENSERFLTDICSHGEQHLKPSLFMQSTHNTIGSMIAIHLGCQGYNNTWSHGDKSFATALEDAWMLLQSGEAETLLVGLHDECTPLQARLLVDKAPRDRSIATVLSVSQGGDSVDSLKKLIDYYDFAR